MLRFILANSILDKGERFTTPYKGLQHFDFFDSLGCFETLAEKRGDCLGLLVSIKLLEYLLLDWYSLE